MATKPTKPLRVNRLEISNFMRIEALTIDAHGNHVLITGKNGSGKTSAVDCLWAILGGKTRSDMPEPVHAGADAAVGRLDLGEYIVERRWTAAGGGSSTLTMRAADGAKVSRPQEIIDGLLGRFTLDPVAFLQRKPADQVADVLAIAGVAPPVEQVQSIVGEAIPAQPDEAAHEYIDRLVGRNGMLYVRRGELNRQAQAKHSAHAEAFNRLLEIGGPVADDEKPIDTAAAHEQLKTLRAQASERAAKQLDVERSNNATNALSHDGRCAGERAAMHKKNCDDIKQQIDRLNAQLLNERTGYDKAVRDADDYKDAAQKASDKWHTEDNALAATPDPQPQIDALEAKINDATVADATIRQRQSHAETCTRLQEEYDAAKTEFDSLDGMIQQVRDVGAGLLDGAKLGIGGLRVADGALRLNDLPFQQASHAEQLRVACAVATKQRPAIRVLRIDDGEHLDADSRAEVLKLAERAGFQVFITAVSDAKSIKVEVVEK